MKVLGIITEYNPFHNGHLYHLEKAKEMTEVDVVVAVMSGNFVQRGEPAILDKWRRAQIAVECGVDLVLELPFVFACNNAEYFAKGAIGILNGIGCVDDIVFGSETGDIDAIARGARFLSDESDTFKERLKVYTDKGLSYPAARAKAFAETSGEAGNLLNSPNDILAVEYLKQIYLTGSMIRPHAIKRLGQGYNSQNTQTPFASASAIRNFAMKSSDISEICNCLPFQSYVNLAGIQETIAERQEKLCELITARILTADTEELSKIFSATEGIENRLKTSARLSHDMDELVGKIKSRRYTETRIRRLLMHTLMGFDKESAEHIAAEKLLYTRVLAFSDKGSTLLRHIRKEECAEIPVVTNINKEIPASHPARALLKFDQRASDIYNLISGLELYEFSDFVRKPHKKSAGNGQIK